MKQTTVSVSDTQLFGIRSASFYTQVDKTYRDKAVAMSSKKRNTYIGRIPWGFIDYIQQQLGIKLTYSNPLALTAAALALKKQYVAQLKIEIKLANQTNLILLDMLKKL